MDKSTERLVNAIIRKSGGYRELSLLEKPHEYEKSGTWNEAHKVVYVTEKAAGPDGYRAGCAVDIVTHSIVG